MNTFLSTINVCLTLQHKNPFFRILWTLGKHFLHLAGCGGFLRSGSQLARGQVNMENESKFYSPIHSTFEVLAVRHTVRHCLAEKLCPFCWPMPAIGVSAFGASHQLAEYISQMSWLFQDSGGCRESVRQHTTKQWPWFFFVCVQVWLWEVLWSFSIQPLSWLLQVV